jgi:glycosyltransferase involved in cell wall biosynthesis
MHKKSTLVSAVIPTRGRSNLVLRAVRSALAQTYKDLEVIVIIDGPELATEKTLEQIGDKRLKVIALSDSVGAAQARNIAVKSARGAWIAFLDDDDEWVPEKTEIQMQRAEDSEYRYPIVSSQLWARTSRYQLVWPRTEPYFPLSEYLLARNSWSYGEGLLSTITLLVPKILLVEIPFRSGLKRHQDLDWVLRAAGHDGAGIEFVARPLAIWHQAENRKSISTGTDWRISLEWIDGVRPMITGRAYASFLATHIAPQAACEGEWDAFPLLLERMVATGKPNARDLLLFFGMWSVPQRIRRMVRKAAR